MKIKHVAAAAVAIAALFVTASPAFGNTPDCGTCSDAPIGRPPAPPVTSPPAPPATMAPAPTPPSAPAPAPQPAPTPAPAPAPAPTPAPAPQPTPAPAPQPPSVPVGSAPEQGQAPGNPGGGNGTASPEAGSGAPQQQAAALPEAANQAQPASAPAQQSAPASPEAGNQPAPAAPEQLSAVPGAIPAMAQAVPASAGNGLLPINGNLMVALAVGNLAAAALIGLRQIRHERQNDDTFASITAPMMIADLESALAKSVSAPEEDVTIVAPVAVDETPEAPVAEEEIDASAEIVVEAPTETEMVELSFTDEDLEAFLLSSNPIVVREHI